MLDKDLSDLSGGGGHLGTRSRFVIMPFHADPEMTPSYDAVRRARSKLHLAAKRADEVVGSGRVIDDIIELIPKSEFIVCDLTIERPNVYYELGYAHGVGNRPLDILLMRGKVRPFISILRLCASATTVIQSILKRLLSLDRDDHFNARTRTAETPVSHEEDAVVVDEAFAGISASKHSISSCRFRRPRLCIVARSRPQGRQACIDQLAFTGRFQLKTGLHPIY